MTDYFAKSSTGLDTNDGLSWATAKASIAAAVALAVGAGDRVFVSNTHSDPATTSKSVVSAGTPSAPVQIFSVDDTVFPSTAVTPGALTKVTGTSTLGLQGSLVAHGLNFAVGSSSSSATMSLATSITVDAIQIYNDCNFDVLGTGSSTGVVVGSSSGSNTARCKVVWNNCTLRTSHAAQFLGAYQDFTWRGGSIVAGSLSTAFLRNSATGRSNAVLIEGVDLTGLAATADLINGANAVGRVTFRNCALPVGWTGQLVQGAIDPGFRAEMHNCDSGDTNYRLWVASFSGTIRNETTVVKTGGSTDGVVPFALKMSTNANPTPGLVGLEAPELFEWNDTINTPVTVSVDIVNDGSLLTNAEVWLDVQYLGTSGLPKSSFSSGKPAPFVTPVVHTTSAATWNTSGFTTARRQKLSTTFTPREAGAIHARVVLAKPSTDLYVDAKLQVS